MSHSHNKRFYQHAGLESLETVVIGISSNFAIDHQNNWINPSNRSLIIQKLVIDSFSALVCHIF